MRQEERASGDYGIWERRTNTSTQTSRQRGLSTRGMRPIENFFLNARQDEAPVQARRIEPNQRLHIRVLSNADEAERRKVVGWFIERNMLSGCRDIW